MKLHLLLITTACAVSLCSLVSAANNALFADPVIAKGKGFEIKRSELDEVTTGFSATAAGRGQKVPPDQMVRVEAEMLQRLIQIRLLVLRMTDKEKESGTELGTKRFDDFKKGAVSEDIFNSKLKSLGSTPEKLKARLIEEAIGELVLNRELRTLVTIKDEEVKKFYDDNPGRFEKPEQVHIAHILLATRSPSGLELPEAERKAKQEKIEDILKKARAGDDFASLAKLYSEDPNSKDKGGDYTFPRGQFVPEFEAAAFALGPGQISGVVTTPFGFHVIKMIEKIPSTRVPLAEVTKDVKQMLEDREVMKRMPDYFNKLKKEYNVEIVADSASPAAGK
jgi:parvulin-like peptidyl-prolyl isomerase